MFVDSTPNYLQGFCPFKFPWSSPTNKFACSRMRKADKISTEKIKQEKSRKPIFRCVDFLASVADTIFV